MKIREIIKKKLYEAVGVPANIDAAAEKIFNDIIEHLTKLINTKPNVADIEDPFTIVGPYSFSDHTIDKIEVTFKNSLSFDGFELLGLYVQHDTDMNIPNITYKRDDVLNLGLRFNYNFGSKTKDFINFIISIKPMIVGSIAHEIMHDYDHAKNPIKKVDSQIDYIVAKEGVGGVYELNLVTIGNYYLHNMENTVRPSEVYTNLMKLGVTKKDFTKRLGEASFIKYLNFFRKLSYLNFMSGLNKSYEDVVYLLEHNGFEIKNDKRYNIHMLLYVVRVFLINKQISIAADISKPESFDDILKQMSGIKTEGEKFFNKYANQISRNSEFLEKEFDYEKSSKLNEQFYTNRINKLAESAERIYRKIAKIYSILPDDNDNTQTLNKKINMRATKNEEVIESSSWENPKILFNKKYPQNLRETIKDTPKLTDKISLLESRIIDEQKEEIKSFILSEMKKIGIEKLPYAYSAFRSFIDPETMSIHYNKHYKGYVKKLNKALSKRKGGDVDLENIIKTIDRYSKDVRNNAGGAFNHALFWNMLSPNKTEMTMELKKKIVDEFTSFAKFKEKFEEVARKRFGSGWVWLVLTPNKKLKVMSTPNQDNPLMNVIEGGGFPLLGLDLWEHAYYLKYQNKRDEYISNFWNVVNWEFVSKMYDMKTNTDL
jgi:Fe-Mn family superoxide dismutase